MIPLQSHKQLCHLIKNIGCNPSKELPNDISITTQPVYDYNQSRKEFQRQPNHQSESRDYFNFQIFQNVVQLNTAFVRRF